MSKFTASNGISVEINDDERITFQIDGVPTSPIWLSPGEMIALREYAIAEEDKRLGRWRWPENPDYIIYRRDRTATFADKRRARVVNESNGDFMDTVEGSGLTGVFKDAARAYFDAHPEPKPWHEAVTGDVWELTTVNGEAAYVATGDRFIHVERLLFALDKNEPTITAGRCVWRAGDES